MPSIPHSRVGQHQRPAGRFWIPQRGAAHRVGLLIESCRFRAHQADQGRQNVSENMPPAAACKHLDASPSARTACLGSVTALGKKKLTVGSYSEEYSNGKTPGRTTVLCMGVSPAVGGWPTPVVGYDFGVSLAWKHSLPPPQGSSGRSKASSGISCKPRVSESAQLRTSKSTSRTPSSHRSLAQRFASKLSIIDSAIGDNR
jgi:hypothetical protein